MIPICNLSFMIIIRGTVMKHDIRAVFFDVDGTLLSETTHKMPQSAKKALRKLRENGILVVVASGRQIDDYDKLPMHDIGFDGYLMCNGGMLLDEHRHMFAGTPIPKEEMDNLSEIFRLKHIPFAISGMNGRYINFVDDTVRKTHQKINSDPPRIGTYSGEDVFMVEAYIPEKDMGMLDAFSDCCSITRWNDTGIDIVPKDSGKTSGIMKFLEKHNLTSDQIMVFGDGENDMEMISYAGIGVAMGNAIDKVKEVADYVTDPVDNDGIEKALKHFNLID